MKAVKGHVTTEEKASLEETSCERHLKYSNHSSEIISTVYNDKVEIWEDTYFGFEQNDSIIQPISTENEKSAYYI